MFLRLPNLASVPAELRRFFDDFRAWAKERERFERSITTEGSFPTSSKRTALKQGVVVRDTRVSENVSGSSVSLNGSLIPDVNNTYDLGSSTFRWRDLFLGRNADIDGTLDVAGNANFGSTLLTGLTATVRGLSVIGHVFGSTSEFRAGTVNILSNGTQSDWYADRGVVIGFHGVTCAGNADFGPIHVFSNATVDGAIGVTGAAEFLGGVSCSTGLTFTGNVATIQNLTVSSGLTGTDGTFSGNVRIDGVLGVTGNAGFAGGFTASGGVTFANTVSFATTAGNGVTGSIFPTVNLTGALGGTLRRWANIFGGTLTLTNAITAGGTMQITADHSHLIGSVGGVNVTTVGHSLNVQGEFFLGGGFQSDTFPAADNNASFGTAALRWKRQFLSGINVEAMGATITAGTTISVDGSGNYHHISGVSDIAGISTSDTIGAAYQPGTRILFHLVNNPSFVNSSRIILSGGVTYSGTTGGMIEFVSEGADNWREVGRRV